MPNPPVPGGLVAKRYRLTRQIGEGAMGAVWAAIDEVTTREVALKLLLRPDPEHRHRLLREARACGALKHKNIIDVFDIMETESGEPFLVMQLLSGETVGDLLARKRRLEPDEAALIGRDVGRALSAAHALQIIHRDLKPANIFLHQEPDVDGYVVKVLDFGIAKNLAASDGLHTVAGGAVGSPFYMSPEQVRGDPNIDPRADIWALGVVLFEMLTGVRPFQGETAEVFAKILTGEVPSVTRYVRRVDDRLAQVVTRCLARERENRYASAAEVVAALEPFAAAHSMSAPLAPGPQASYAAPAVPVATPRPAAGAPASMPTAVLPAMPPAVPGAMPGAVPGAVPGAMAGPPRPMAAPPSVPGLPGVPGVPGMPPSSLTGKPPVPAGVPRAAPSVATPLPRPATVPSPAGRAAAAMAASYQDPDEDEDEAPTAFYKPEQHRGSSPSLPDPPATARFPEASYSPATGTPPPGMPFPVGLGAGIADPSTEPGWASGGTVRMAPEDAARYRLEDQSAPFQGGNVPPAPPPPPGAGMPPGYGPQAAGAYAPPGGPGFPPGPGTPGTGDNYPPAPQPLLGQPPFGPAASSMSPLVRTPGGPVHAGAPSLADENPFAPKRPSKAMLALLAGLVVVFGIISVSLIMVLTEDPPQPTPATPGTSESAAPTAQPTPPATTAAPSDPAPEAQPSATPSAGATATTARPPTTATAPATAQTPRPTATATSTAKPPKRDCSKLKLLERQRCERGY